MARFWSWGGGSPTLSTLSLQSEALALRYHPKTWGSFKVHPKGYTEGRCNVFIREQCRPLRIEYRAASFSLPLNPKKEVELRVSAVIITLLLNLIQDGQKESRW